MRAAFVGATAFMAAAVVSLDASAHEPWSYGVGSRAAAMGGAVSADATDFSANYYNPAGLVGEEGLRLGVGYLRASHDLLVNGVDSGVGPAGGFSFGLAASGNAFGLPIALGIATHIPDNGLSQITALREGVPRWELYDGRATVLYLTANLAIRPWEFLEIGGGLSFLAATRGRFEVTGTADALSPYESQLRHTVDADLTSVRYPQAGVRVHLGDLATLALVYRHETALRLELDARLEGNIEFSGLTIPLLYTLSSKTVAAFLPAQLVVGSSVRPLENLKINFDVTWVRWSAYESPTARTAAELLVDVPDGIPIELPERVFPTEPEPPRFSDRIVPRLGFEVMLLPKDSIVRIPLRGGYVFERSPIPPQSGITNFIDSDRHTMSAGTGVVLQRILGKLDLSLDAHFAFSQLPLRVTEKKNPADLVGDYEAEGRIFAGGTTLGMGFK